MKILNLPQIYEDAVASLGVFKCFLSGGVVSLYDNNNLVTNYSFDESLERRIYNLVVVAQSPIDAVNALALYKVMSAWLSFLKTVEECGPRLGSFYPPFVVSGHHLSDGLTNSKHHFLITARKK